MLSRMSVVSSMLDRQVYLYSEVDRLVGMRAGTSRRWINGYTRAGKSYHPILRESRTDSEWATWGEFVETRILSEFRGQNIPTQRLRAAVESLREVYQVPYPLAHLRPYLAADTGELALDLTDVKDLDEEGRLILRTRQLLLSAPARSVLEHAILAVDEHGEKYAAEITLDEEYPGIVLSPDRLGGQPTFTGRRVSIATIAGMVKAGEDPSDLAADYGLSLSQVRSAVDYAVKHRVAA